MKLLLTALVIMTMTPAAFAYGDGANSFNNHQGDYRQSYKGHNDNSYGSSSTNRSFGSENKQAGHLDDKGLADLNLQRAQTNVSRLIKNLSWLEQNPTVSDSKKAEYKRFDATLTQLGEALKQ